MTDKSAGKTLQHPIILRFCSVVQRGSDKKGGKDVSVFKTPE